MGHQMLLEVRGCGKGFRALTAFVIFNLVVYPVNVCFEVKHALESLFANVALGFGFFGHFRVRLAFSRRLFDCVFLGTLEKYRGLAFFPLSLVVFFMILQRLGAGEFSFAFVTFVTLGNLSGVGRDRTPKNAVDFLHV